MHRLGRTPQRALWASLGLAALFLTPYAVRYWLVSYRLEGDIEATEREQKDWVRRDRAEGEALKRQMQESAADLLRRHRLSTQPSVEPEHPGPLTDCATQPAAN